MTRARLRCYASPAQPCPYLPDRLSSNLFADPVVLDNELYSQLIRLGFRRSGAYIYQPRCPSCSACVPVRVALADFRPRRRHRRCLQTNQDIRLTIKRNGLLDEYLPVCQSYLDKRHPGGGMDTMHMAELGAFLSCAWSQTEFLEFRKDDRLLAIAATDRVADGLSAVYTFFDPDNHWRGLGTYAILKQIEYARKRELSWLYLGYWIEECAKMNYKSGFQPLQVFNGSEWTEPNARRASAPGKELPATVKIRL